MKKQQLDDLTFLNIYEKEDLKINKTVNSLLSSCEKILKSNKNLDPTEEINELKDKVTNFFLENYELLVIILYSKDGCDVGKRKALAFSYLSSEDSQGQFWTIDFVKSRYDANLKNKEILLEKSIEILKTLDAKHLSVSIKNNDKESISFFNSFMETNHLENSDIAFSPKDHTKTSLTSYNFNLFCLVTL